MRLRSIAIRRAWRTRTSSNGLRAVLRSSDERSGALDNTSPGDNVITVLAHGESARYVRFTETDGSTTYLATYTAFDGVHVSQQLLRTDDFISFDASPVVGAAALNKGLALFPRRINGRYAALTRYDRDGTLLGSAETTTDAAPSTPTIPRLSLSSGYHTLLERYTARFGGKSLQDLLHAARSGKRARSGVGAQ